MVVFHQTLSDVVVMDSKSFPVRGIFRNNAAAFGTRADRHNVHDKVGVLAEERLLSGRLPGSLSGYRGFCLRTIGTIMSTIIPCAVGGIETDLEIKSNRIFRLC